jgi:adenylate kinase
LGQVTAIMPLNLIMLGPPGAGKGTQAERFARSRGIPKISTGDILREAVHAGTEIGLRAKTVMDRGELVSDDVMIGIVKERLEREDALGGFVLDGFPRTVVQAAALDAIMAERNAIVVVDIVVPEAELVRRLASRMICDDCGANAGGFAEVAIAADKVILPPAVGSAALETLETLEILGTLGTTKTAMETVAAVQAQTEPQRCRRCGGRLVQRTDDNVDVVRERLKIYHRQTAPLVKYYHGRPTFRQIDGAQPAERVAADLASAIEAAGNAMSRVGGRR